MSYNIDNSKYLSGQLSIQTKDARRLAEKYRGDLPEINFLDYLDLESDEDSLPIENPWWCGSGSGYAYDDCLVEILKQTRGWAVIVFVWEGGDSHSVLEVHDGRVKQKQLKMAVE
jgi:hypothetical protein